MKDKDINFKTAREKFLHIRKPKFISRFHSRDLAGQEKVG